MNNYLSIIRRISIFLIFIVGTQNVFAWTAQGASGIWSFPVPGGWYGGSYYQIMKVIKDAEQRGEGDQLHIQILRSLSREARGLDAILFHIESSADGKHGNASFLKINITPATGTNDGFPSIDKLTTELFLKLGTRILGSTPGATDIKLLNHQEDLTIMGNRAAAVNYKLTMGGGRDDRYDGTVFIYRQTSVMTFNISAPWHVNSERHKEMWDMLRSIRFK